jgi:hypothetical protein
LVVRVPPLDAASVRLVLAAISAWHVQASMVLKHANPPISLLNPVRSQETVLLSRTMMSYCKHPTVKKLCFAIPAFYALLLHGFPNRNRYSPHQQLFAMLCAFGPLRPGAAANLTVTYTTDGDVVTTSLGSQVRLMPPDAVWPCNYVLLAVHVDKNVTPDEPRMVYIPRTVLGIEVYDAVHDYILHMAPPSGGFLLAAPMAPSGVKFYTTPYGNFGTALKAAVTRVHPDMDSRQFGAGSPRKSMAQWLYAAGVPRHVIADVGGWTLASRDAMDGYHETDPYMILKVKSDLPWALEMGSN